MNNDLSDNEVNKIIAGFMNERIISYDGEQYIDNHHIPEYRDRVYTESLDSLVPVWEKLRKKSVLITLNPFEHCESTVYIKINYNFTDTVENKSIRIAAAHATAKAILELSEV